MKIKSGSINVSVYYYIVQDASSTSPGEPVTGLLFSDIETGGSASYVRQGAARSDLTIITLASANAAHSDGGFILVDDTNMPGLYRCDYPDAAFATGVDQVFLQIVVASANNAVAAPILVDIDDNVDQTADHAAGIADIPTVAEFNARTLATADYFDPAVDAVATVTTLTNKTGFSLAATGLDAIVSTATGMVEIAKSIWDRVLTGATHNIATSAGRRVREVIDSVVIFSDTAQASTANTITLSTGASSVDGTYDPSTVAIVGGTGAGQTRLILQYEGATRIATVDRNWKVAPDGTSVFTINSHPGREHVNEGLAQAGAANTITLNPLASSVDGTYIGQMLFLRSGTGEDQAALVVDYDGTTKIATVDRNWGVAPDATTGYVMLPNSPMMLGNTTHTGAVIPTVTTLTGHTAQTGDNFARLGAPAGASVSADIAALNDITVNELLTTQMTESYAADGTAPTVAQALFAIQQFLQERSTATTTVTVKKLDGSTSAMTFTLDDATTPTSITRAT